MKKHINRNILWADLFVEQLAACGVKYACISPGSRSTPLTYAFSHNRKIKKYLIIDERSSGFFALGLAKSTNSPVAVITTSGTATAELYPAIVEAFQQRTPLIICTGDRPPELYGCGANQTINQINIYGNHIRKFFNAGIPSINESKLKSVKRIAAEAFNISLIMDRGPVHVNFPFRKPFEPDSFTNEVDTSFLKKVHSIDYKEKNPVNSYSEKKIASAFKKINYTEKGIIVCGPGEQSKAFYKLLNRFSAKTKFPIFADSSSSARFINNKYIITNYNSFLRLDDFIKKYDPELILQFGAAPTTKHFLEFFEKSKAEKILINEFGDLLDPSRTSNVIIKIQPEHFLRNFIEGNFDSKSVPVYSNSIKVLDKIINNVRNRFIAKSKFPFEGRIVTELLSIIPSGSNLIVSNSMPVRDLDYFAEAAKNNIKVYSNRGASGIDGMNSTALGIAASSKRKTILITGDLSFYHDLNGLLTGRNYKIPIIIILVNNNGGAVFEMLPIKRQKNIFNEYFKTPHNLNFKKIVHGYDGHFMNIKNWKSFRTEFSKALNRKTFTVLHFKTDSSKSHSMRKKFWHESIEITKNILNDN